MWLALTACAFAQLPPIRLIQSRPTATAAVWPYYATAFSGSGQYLTRSAFTGSVTNSSGTISVWFKSTTNGAAQYLFNAAGSSSVNRTYVSKTAANKISVAFASVTGSGSAYTSTAVFTNSDWHHVYASVDLVGAPADTSKRSVYIDGASAAGSWTAWTEASICWNGNYVGIGALNNGSSLLTGSISELVIYPGSGFRDPATYITSFRSAAGKPVSLGTTGSAPWAQTPIYYGAGVLLEDKSGNAQTLTAVGPPTDSADKP